MDTDSGFIAVGKVPSSTILKGDNVGIGDRALRYNNSFNNTGVGRHTLEYNVIGENNTAIGWFAGSNNVSEFGNDHNTFLGALSNTVSGSTVENSTAVGYGAVVTTSNTVQLGNYNTESVNTSGYITAAGFYGDGSGLTNVGLGGIDQNGNLMIVDSKPTLTTSQTFNILIGNDVASQLSNGTRNVAIGGSALASATLTSNNVALGIRALSSVTGENGSSGMNTAVGDGASYSLKEGWINVSVGLNSMADFEIGNGNVVVGAGAMEFSLGGDNNTAIGTRALKSLIPNGTVTLTVNNGTFQYPSGQGNTAVGNSAMEFATGGSYNTAVGEASLSRNTTGFNNSSFGSHSLSKNETGNGNSAFGWGALSEITEGGANTALGDHAGWSLTGNSHHNTFVGWNSGVVSGTTDILNSIAIGSQAQVNSSNMIQLGDEAIELVNTSGKVSATSFKGNGDDITITDQEGVLVTLLDKISQLESEINQLKAHQSNTTSISAYQFFEKHGGKIWASSSTDNTTSDLAVGNGYLQFSVLNDVLSNNKVATDLYVYDQNIECLDYFLGDNPDDNCSGVVIQLISNSPDEVVFKTIDYDECENGSDGSMSEITFTVVGDRMYSSEVGESTLDYYTLVSSVEGSDCFD